MKRNAQSLEDDQFRFKKMLANFFKRLVENVEKVILWLSEDFPAHLSALMAWLMGGQWYEVILKLSGAIGVLSLLTLFAIGFIKDRGDSFVKSLMKIVLGILFYAAVALVLVTIWQQVGC